MVLNTYPPWRGERWTPAQGDLQRLERKLVSFGKLWGRESREEHRFVLLSTFFVPMFSSTIGSSHTDARWSHDTHLYLLPAHRRILDLLPPQEKIDRTVLEELLGAPGLVVRLLGSAENGADHLASQHRERGVHEPSESGFGP